MYDTIVDYHYIIHTLFLLRDGLKNTDKPYIVSIVCLLSN